MGLGWSGFTVLLIGLCDQCTSSGKWFGGGVESWRRRWVYVGINPVASSGIRVAA